MENINFRNNSPKCYHHNVGYCKHGACCRYQHFSYICQKRSCEQKLCPARHPRRCKNGEECKFVRKNICAYSHVEEDQHEKVHELKKELESLKALNRKLENENNKLREEAKVHKNVAVQNENNELNKEVSKVKNDIKNLKDENVLEKKEGIIKTNFLREANKIIDKFKDDLASEVRKHQISKDAIKELHVKVEEAEKRFRKYSATIRILLSENESLKLTK